jgi:hypothetical protein
MFVAFEARRHPLVPADAPARLVMSTVQLYAFPEVPEINPRFVMLLPHGVFVVDVKLHELAVPPLAA